VAAPAKAYIDPTYLSRYNICPPQIYYPVVHPLPNYFGQVVGLPQDERLPLIQLNAPILNHAHYARVPTPPMGRQLILTFPSIYREREVFTGRLYPTGIR
jgi:hypothetical protein